MPVAGVEPAELVEGESDAVSEPVSPHPVRVTASRAKAGARSRRDMRTMVGVGW